MASRPHASCSSRTRTEDFANLLASLEDEYQPETASETFLITEMARAQWKLGRIEAIEAAVLAGWTTDSDDPGPPSPPRWNRSQATCC